MHRFNRASLGFPDRAASRGALWLTLLGLGLLGSSVAVGCSDSDSSEPHTNAGGSGGMVNEGGAGSGGNGTGGGANCIEAPDKCGVLHRWCPPEPAPPMTTCGGAGGMGGGGAGGTDP